MRCARIVGCLLALSALMAPGVAHAQIFSVYTPRSAKPDEPTRGGDTKFRRLQVGTFLAIWDQPPVSNLPIVVAIGGVPGLNPNQQANADVDPDASPLITLDYFLLKNLSVGGWWNPLAGTANVDRGVLTRVRRQNPGTRPVFIGSTDFGFRDNFYDAHVTWYFPEKWGFLPRFITRGLSVQGGYSVQNIDLDAEFGPNNAVAFQSAGGGAPSADAGLTKTSPNAWLTKSFNLGRPLRSKRPISLFASGGYYFDDDFDKAWNAIGGISAQLSSRLTLSGSYWRVMPQGGQDQSRVSVGLTARY